MSKFLGGFLTIAGIGLLIFALQWDTSVATDMGVRVNNIGLIEERRTMLMIGALIVLVGVLGLLFAKPVSTVGAHSPTPAPEPTGNTGGSVVALPQFKGEREITNDAYQLYLTRKYGIERNTTLEKFVLVDRLFPTLGGALAAAHSLEEEFLASPQGAAAHEEAKLMKLYGITKVQGMYSVQGYDFDDLPDAIQHAMASPR